MEQIEAAAIIDKATGLIFTMERPSHHHDIVERLPYRAGSMRKGFITSEGRFVSRSKAFSIANEAGQYHETGKYSTECGKLHSENVW